MTAGLTNDVADEERNGGPTIWICDDLVKTLPRTFLKDCFRISFEIPQIALTVPYEVIRLKLGSCEFCLRWVPKIFTLTQPLTELSTGNIKIKIFLESKVWPVRRPDNLTAICESTVWTMCVILNISQPYMPPKPVTGIAFYCLFW
jgi:hypothetical protein